MASDGEKGKARLAVLLLLIGAGLGVRQYLRHRVHQTYEPVKSLPSQEVVAVADADASVRIQCRPLPKGTVRRVRTSVEMTMTGGDRIVVQSYVGRRTDRFLDPEGGRIEYVFHEAVVHESGFPGLFAPPDLEKPYVVTITDGGVDVKPAMSAPQANALAYFVPSFDHLCDALPDRPLTIGGQVPELSSALSDSIGIKVSLDHLQANGSEAYFRLEQAPVDSGVDAITFESPAGSRLVVRVSDGQPLEVHQTTTLRMGGAKASSAKTYIEYTATFD